MDSVIVAYSGGVDSALLAVAAHRALGERALAVTAVSPALAARELDGAVDLAQSFRFPPPDDPDRRVGAGRLCNQLAGALLLLQD